MARSFSPCLAKISTSSRCSSRLIASRPNSDFPYSLSEVIEDPSSSTDPLLRKLEDAIHRIIVRRAAPDWLPFIPGSSYWVPPPGSAAPRIAHLVEKLADPLTDEESLSMTTARGWPSSDYFVNGTLPHPAKVEVSPAKVFVETSSGSTSQSEDEEP